MRVLIVKLGALGDVINTFPLAVTLKRELGCTIDWLVAPLSHPLVAAHACVDRAILFDRSAASFIRVVKFLRKTDYAIALDLQRIAKSSVFTLAANAGRRIGFDRNRCKEMTWLFPFERIRASDPQAHMLVQYMEFARHLELPWQSISWEIPRTGLAPDGIPNRYVVLNIGATKPANLWQSEAFARLATLIHLQFGLPCVITGGPEDRTRSARIIDAGPASMVDLAGRTSLPELVEVIAGAACVISCDTGPMHLASALGTPLVALFGPSNPDRTGPFQGRVIQEKPGCSPCNKKQCPAPICMEAITPSRVMEDLSQLLQPFQPSAHEPHR